MKRGRQLSSWILASPGKQEPACHCGNGDGTGDGNNDNNEDGSKDNNQYEIANIKRKLDALENHNRSLISDKKELENLLSSEKAKFAKTEENW